ncbi:MAG: helix-turn-helix domain-containing protein [Actinomycetia bacterium]|nr:helix-turn-helix domain-containing protein [Actinomycetes bacterium]
MSPTALRTSIPGYDAESLYRAVASRDRRFDGRFVLGVTSTGIYCRPSCLARTPKPENVRYYALPAAAVAAGFRACRRCRPDRVSPRPHIADETGLVDRALVLIGQGVVDDAGVAGLAERMSVSERHLHRLLMTSVGTGALGLAQARRAQVARTLLEQTVLPVTDVAFTSGFGSLRQFNDVMRAEYGASPSELRRHPAKPDRPANAGSLTLRLPVTVPWDGGRLLAFLGTRAVTGVEAYDGDRYVRTLATPSGSAVLELEPGEGAVHVQLTAADLGAIGPAMVAVRRLCDLAADIEAVETGLSGSGEMRAMVRRRPGLRVPGAVDGWEILVRAIVGQQVSVAAARTFLGRIVERCGPEIDRPPGEDRSVHRLFPSAEAMAEGDLDGLGLTGRRVATLRAAAESAAAGALLLEPGDDLSEARRRLVALPGIGPWTAEYVALRALADPDAWPGTDLVLARAASGIDVERLRPWRAYAGVHLWTRYSEETA